MAAAKNSKKQSQSAGNSAARSKAGKSGSGEPSTGSRNTPELEHDDAPGRPGEWSASRVRDWFGGPDSGHLKKDRLSEWAIAYLGKTAAVGKGSRQRTYTGDDARKLARLLQTTGDSEAAMAAFEFERRQARAVVGQVRPVVTRILNAVLSRPMQEKEGDERLPLVFRKVEPALRQLAVLAKPAVPAEHCAILLFCENEPENLVIVADSREAPDAPHTGHRFALTSSGCTIEAFRTGKVVNKYGPELDGDQSAHLRTERTSVLALPLRNRRGKVIGVFKVENRTTGATREEGHPVDKWPLPFTADEEKKAALIALSVQLTLEFDSIMTAQDEVADRLQGRMSFRSAARAAIHHITQLIGVKIGEVGTMEKPASEEYEWIIQASTQAGSAVGQHVPEPSICSTVLRDRKPGIVPIGDPKPRNYYHRKEDEERRWVTSELAYPVWSSPWEHPDRSESPPFGVINLESVGPARTGKTELPAAPFPDGASTTGLSEDAAVSPAPPRVEADLTDADLPLVGWFSRLLGVAAHVASLRCPIERSLGDVSSANELFSGLLASAIAASRQSIGPGEEGLNLFDKGIGYLANYETGVLTVVAWHGLAEDKRTRFHLPFDLKSDEDQYAAARALRTNTSFFSRFPVNDTRVAQQGLADFGIDGSLLAVPVRFPSTLTPITIGALVLWSTNRVLLPEDVKQATPAIERAAQIVPKVAGSAA